MTKQKSLGQIAYEAVPEIGLQSFTSWTTANPAVHSVYTRIAAAVAREVQKRLRKRGKEGSHD